jgi:DNA-directed RNA polymerase specialized sigma24 family protein
MNFPATRHSVIERLRGAEETGRREAFGDLVTGYWKPVYKYVRLTWRLSDDDAQDLTQAFFSDAYQKAWLERYEPGKARFRTFVRLCADRFVMNWKQSAGRMKRGGASEVVPLDFDSAEREVLAQHASVPPDAEEFFHREFIRALFDRAIARVRAEYEGEGRTIHLQLFDRYDVAPEDGVSYATLAHDFNLTSAQVTNYLAQVRRSFRTSALEALESLTGSREEFRREARELFGLEIE